MSCSAHHSGSEASGRPPQTLSWIASGEVRNEVSDSEITSDALLVIESKLDTHDAVFAIPTQGDDDVVYRLLLLSTSDATKSDTEERIERLSVLSGGAHIAIILLLVGDDAMTAFTQLQMKLVTPGL